MFGGLQLKLNELVELVLGLAEILSGSLGAPLVLSLIAAVAKPVEIFPALSNVLKYTVLIPSTRLAKSGGSCMV